jgi:hypothetical protein
VSEWLLFNDSSAIFQLFHGENKLILNVMKKDNTENLKDEQKELHLKAGV